MSEKPLPKVLSDPHPSGLVRAAFQTGRERGSSATPMPSLQSPTPTRSYQKHLDNLSNLTLKSPSKAGNSSQISQHSRKQGHNGSQSSLHSSKAVNFTDTSRTSLHSARPGNFSNVSQSSLHSGKHVDLNNGSQISPNSDKPLNFNNGSQVGLGNVGHSSRVGSSHSGALVNSHHSNRSSTSFRSDSTQARGGAQVGPSRRGSDSGDSLGSSSTQISIRSNTIVNMNSRSSQHGNHSKSQTHRSQGSRESQSSSSSNSSVTFNQLAGFMQTRILELQEKIRTTPGLPRQLQDILVNECGNIGHEFNEKQRHLQEQFNQIQNEKVHLKGQLEKVTIQAAEAEQKARSALSDRANALKEKDELQEQVRTLNLKAQKSDERLNELEIHWKGVEDTLLKRITAQEEQIKGKRALWLESNPGSSARRDAMTAIRDPFNSPSATGSFGGGMKSSFGTPATSPSAMSPLRSSFGAPPQMTVPTGPALRAPRRRPNINLLPNLPTGRAKPAPETPDLSSFGQFGSNKIFNTEPGDTPMITEVPKSTALVVHSSDEDPVVRYAASIARIYGLVEGWVKTYASVPNLASEQGIARSNQELWDYMMNCTYPGRRQEAHTHVMVLLGDVRTRFWFVMRMCIGYCAKEILAAKVFFRFSTHIDEQLEEVRTKLQERGLANEARQKLIDQQTRAVKSIVSSPSYENFRSAQVAYHTRRLRDMLGPLLNDVSARHEAGKDLGAIVVGAWDLTIDMHTSNLTFQVYFPETAAKFTAATMTAMDRPNIQDMELQLRQCRLKLVITPVITMRDDRGTTIIAKNLHRSTVLTMD